MSITKRLLPLNIKKIIIGKVNIYTEKTKTGLKIQKHMQS